MARRPDRSPLKDELYGGNPLTMREKVLLVGASRGETAEDSATRLGVGVETVKSQRKLILVKLQARTMAQAVANAYRKGILMP